MEKEIEPFEIKMDHGHATIYFERGSLEICYRLRIDGKLYSKELGIDLIDMRYYLPGPLKFMLRAFYNSGRPPFSKTDTVDNRNALKQYESFIQDHGQTIIDKAVELGVFRI